MTWDDVKKNAGKAKDNIAEKASDAKQAVENKMSGSKGHHQAESAKSSLKETGDKASKKMHDAAAKVTPN